MHIYFQYGFHWLRSSLFLGGGGQEFGLFVNSNDDKQQAVKITNQRLFSSVRTHLNL
jgi:hypothetical protein